MRYKNYIFIILMVLSLSANAEVFKCKNATGKIIYQQVPCSPGTATQGIIEVKEMTPEEAEKAKVKLKAWQEQQAIDTAAKKEAEKERQAQLEKQESLELQRRSVMAQEQQLLTEQQRQQQIYRPIVVPAYDFNRYYRNNRMQSPYGGWGYPNDRHRDGWQPNQPKMFPPYQTYKEPPPPPFRSSSSTGKTAPRSGNPGPGRYDQD